MSKINSLSLSFGSRISRFFSPPLPLEVALPLEVGAMSFATASVSLPSAVSMLPEMIVGGLAENVTPPEVAP